ncbi:MAG: phosphohydrolase [Treponema sp.]|nr:phosphohydrolase [Treponema sp.]
MEKIEISRIKPGIRFSQPVFFDDGKNMFIESGISVKPYHLAALTKWHIPFLLSNGHILAENETIQEEIEELSEILDEIESAQELDESAELIQELDSTEELEEL